MLSFKEWLRTKYKKSKVIKDVKPASQGSPEIGNVNNQRQTNRSYKEIVTNDIQYFPEPK